MQRGPSLFALLKAVLELVYTDMLNNVIAERLYHYHAMGTGKHASDARLIVLVAVDCVVVVVVVGVVVVVVVSAEKKT